MGVWNEKIDAVTDCTTCPVRLRQTMLDQIRKDWTKKQAVYKGWLETHKTKMIAEGLWDAREVSKAVEKA